MSTPIQKAPFLRVQRDFPRDSLEKLTVQLDKMYVDVANSVNERTIGIYALNNQVTTGESWYNGTVDGSSYKIQTLREFYNFTTTTNINHGIKNVTAEQFTRCWGSYSDGTNGYGLIWTSSVAIAGQISFYVNATQIVFVTGSVAPVPTSGRVILEWLIQV